MSVRLSASSSAGAAPPGRTRGLIWAAGDRAPADLGALPGGSDSRARDISPDGRVVGVAASGGGDRTFVWTAATGMVNLNTLVAAGGLVLLVDAVGACCIKSDPANDVGVCRNR